MYRLCFFTFGQAFNQGVERQRLHRWLHPLHAAQPSPAADHEHPLRAPQQRWQRVAHHLPVRADEPTSKNHTTFGDISFTPRVLLPETKDFSLTAEVAVVTPTGNQPLAGKTSLTPDVSFWNNFAGGWVIRGGLGDYVPLGGTGATI